MTTALRVTLASRALRLEGRDPALSPPLPLLPLFSGALHYFRVPRRHWQKCLRAVRQLGLETVETYVPWGVHETTPGRYRFEGDLDLGAFLDLAHAEGLKAIVRPGPHINAELTWFGFPERIVTDPAMQARTGRDTPAVLIVPPRGFPVPSYASERFLAAVGDWYKAVGEVVGKRLFPEGPVVAVQVDNEQGHFFRAGPFDSDYHPDALAAWGEDSGGMAPPRALPPTAASGELAQVLAWLAFKDRQQVRALTRMSLLLEAAGLTGVPRYHNFPPVDPGIFDVAAAETALDFAGIDLYHSRRQYTRVRERALYLAGSSRLPYVPELAAGSFPWGPPFEVADTRALTLGALMHGVAGVNYYMAVERDRWYGAPISQDGEVRPEFGGLLTRLHAALAEADWTSLARPAGIGVLLPREYRRLAVAASHLGPVGPVFGELMGLGEQETLREASYGLSQPVQLEQAAWRTALVEALGRAHLPYVLVAGGAPLDVIAKRRLLIVPTFDFLDVELGNRLRAYAAAGGRLVTGPRTPTRDLRLEPSAELGELPGERLGAEMLADRHRLQEALASWAAAAGVERVAPAKEPNVDTALHVRPDGTPALLFVGTSSAQPLTAAVELDKEAELEDVLGGERLRGQTLAVPLEPFQVRLLRFV